MKSLSVFPLKPLQNSFNDFMSIAPSLFVSHGAPTFALESEGAARQLRGCGESLKEIKAVLVVSPHWQTHGIEVLTTLSPKTIHDFYGFPEPLYSLQYPATGCPEWANVAAQLLSKSTFPVTINHQRGLDHGAWVPLMHLFPTAQVPTFQISMPHSLNTGSAYQMGRLLAPLREQGILILGSGGITHNLHDLGKAASDLVYVGAFSRWIREALLNNQLEQLLDYREVAPNAKRAHPTEEHLLPLLIALGASDPEDRLEIIEGGVSYNILSMDSYLWRAQA
jgi:4,5-DOPA dioxygenase extradiol